MAVELTGPIVFKSTPERIAFAAVLVPGEPDLDAGMGEKILTVEEVERVANQWLADYGNIDLLHSLNNVAVPVQSYTTYSERTVDVGGETLTLPQGTWILGSRLDESTWKAVVDGTLTGYSVMGIRKTALKEAIGAMKSGAVDIDASLKKTLIKDLGPDWVAPFVSVVDTPAVPKSKWFVLKSSGDVVSAEDHKVWYEKLKELVLGTGSAADDRTVSDIVSKEEESSMDEAVLKELVAQAVTEALHGGVEDRLATLEEEVRKSAEAELVVGEILSTDADEEFRSEILARLEKLEAHKSGSKALKGHDDGGADGKTDLGRDLYGRKRQGGM